MATRYFAVLALVTFVYSCLILYFLNFIVSGFKPAKVLMIDVVAYTRSQYVCLLGTSILIAEALILIILISSLLMADVRPKTMKPVVVTFFLVIAAFGTVGYLVNLHADKQTADFAQYALNKLLTKPALPRTPPKPEPTPMDGFLGLFKAQPEK